MRTFGRITYEKDARTWVFNDVLPHVMIKIKSVFHGIPRTTVCPFGLNHTKELAVDLHWFLTRYPMRITLDDQKFLADERVNQLELLDEMEGFFLPHYAAKPMDLKKPLRKYQSQGVELYWRARRLLIGDVVGLGKTAIAIGSFCEPQCLPAAVVVQTHLPTQWKEQIEMFSGLTVHIVKNGPVYQLPPADVYIFKYSQLAKWVNIFTEKYFKSVAFDEIQELRREGSQKYEGGKTLARNTNYSMGLSATPIFNYGDEIWNILDLLKEGSLGEKSDFNREWCGYGGVVTKPQALGTYLRENFLFLRRTREEVGMELPALNVMVETVETDQAALDNVEAIARMLAIKVVSGSFEERGRAARDLDIMVRQATGIAKARYVAQYVRMLVECGESVLVAGWHRDVYEIWNKELADLKPVMYTGSESPAQKEKSKNAFISGEAKLMFISLRSGAGLDGLQKRGSIVVLGELDWSPAIHEQLIGRLNRDGQASQVTAIYLVSESGSDPGIVDLLGLKASQASGITDPFTGPTEQFSDRGRIKALAQRYLRDVHRPIGDLFDQREGVRNQGSNAGEGSGS